MMGYDVIEIDDGSVKVTLRTNGGFGCMTLIRPDDFYKDFIIEEVVRLLNHYIIKEL